jgi:hypothetical protein
MRIADALPSFVITLAATAIAAAPRPALADPPQQVTVDQPRQEDPAERHQIDRTMLYVDDARVAAPLTAIGMASATYTSVGSDPERVYTPFAFNTAQPGVLMSLGGEVGLLPHLSVMAMGQMAAGGETSHPNAGVLAGVRVGLLPLSLKHVHLVASLGYLREAWTQTAPDGDNGIWGALAASGDIYNLRLAGTVHLEHVFHEDRDAVDIMVQAGANYRVVGPLRLGAEWVGQDLEESFNDAAEGGARNFLGPTASVQLLGDRLSIAAGPSFGIGDRSPKVLGRLALAYGF